MPNATPDASASPLDTFNAAVAAYRKELVAIEQLKSEFQTATADQRDAINQQLRERHPESARVLEEMVQAAIAAYQADPKADPQVENLLVSVAAHRIAGAGKLSQGGDDYEAALQVIDVLAAGGAKNDQLPLWGILAATTTNNFEAAEKYLKLADESGALSQPPDGKNKIASEVFSTAIGLAQSIPQLKQSWAAEQAIRQAEAEADDLPRVRMSTTEGDLVIELFENEAPQAVASFITRVKEGFYDGVVFHRVLPRFMAQGGDPTGTGTGGPGYNIRCECYQPNARKHFRGSLSMAHAGRDTGGSQFFLTFMPTSFLDGRHTVFGRVVDGWDVLAKLIRVDPEDGRAELVSRIEKAEVLRDRGYDYSTRFDRLPER